MIGKYLVDKGIITQKQLEEALEEQKKTGEFLGAILINRRYASEHVIAKGLSEELGLAFMDLSKYSIEPAAIKLVPETVCRKYTLIPVYQAGHNLTVAMADPLDIFAIDELRGFVDAMPKLIGNAGEREPEGTGGTAVASLSAEVRKIAKLAGHDPEAFAKVANNDIRSDEGEV